MERLVTLAWHEHRSGGQVDLADVERWFESAEGKLFRWWLGFRRYQPGITQDEVDEIIVAHAQEVARLDRATDGMPLGNSPSPQPIQAAGDSKMNQNLAFAGAA